MSIACCAYMGKTITSSQTHSENNRVYSNILHVLTFTCAYRRFF